MGTIKTNRKIAPGHYLLSVSLRDDDKKPLPGQFYMIRCSDASFPLLRRPLSVHAFREAPLSVDFLYSVVGTGTYILSRRREGEDIDILGPLGRGFEPKEETEHILLIAGGIGLAPLPYLAEGIAEKGPLLSPLLLFGAKGADQILCLDRFKRLGFEIVLYTEDGSIGKKGCVTEDLDQILETFSDKGSMVFACGPTGMLEIIANRCISRKIPCQVSLDRRMACGVGACLGCAIRSRDDKPGKAYKKVCVDGPVFDAYELSWSWEKGEERCPH